MAIEANNVEEDSKAYYWYHCVDLLNGFVTDGDYDLRDQIGQFGFPEDMKGLTALDVGRASGYFAFEMEERGADVTACDIPSFLDWDFVGGPKHRQELAAQVGDVETYSRQQITGAFEFARWQRKSKVKAKLINAYHLSPEAFDGQKFDVVFAGSITSHLRDPILAFEKLHSVTRGKCIISAPTFEIAGTEQVPLMWLVGTSDSDRRSWWSVNEKALVEMLKCACFDRIEIHSRMEIAHRRLPDLKVPHVVVHAYV